MNSPIKWMGGKYRLRKQIIELIPEHVCYVEVFGGAAWPLFAKQPSKVEVYNDINGELVNFFRIVQKHPEEFIRCFDDLLVSRELFENFKCSNLRSLTDIERAVRFYYLIQCSFGAKTQNFIITPTRAPKVVLKRVKEDIALTRERLINTIIENRDFEQIINSYDRDETFFYLDPPYYETTGYKTQGSGEFTLADQVRLRDRLRNIKGKFLLSLNDKSEVRELYEGFNIKETTVNYSVNNSKIIKAKELFIMNY